MIPERLTCPTQDQSVPSGKIKIHSPGLLRKILFVLSAVIVIAVVGGVVRVVLVSLVFHVVGVWG